MKFTIKGSHFAAILITAVIAVWMYFGDIKIGGQGASADGAPPIAQREEETASDLFRVSYVKLDPEQRVSNVTLRGRTKAEAIIPVRAETGGVLQQRLVNRGDRVEPGQLVCVIDSGSREASLESARARLAQMEADYAANKELSKKGFSTDTKLRQMLFDLNAAKAQMREAQIELDRTGIKANASGVVQDPIAEPGDVLAPGGACITLVDRDPMYFTGQLSERHINSVSTGMTSTVELITGKKTQGTINYISPSADAQTRTFTVEIRLDGAGNEIRDGLTAVAAVQLPETSAFKISPSWLTLAESGEVGLKVLDDENKVQFQKVTIVSRANDGFWITGLEPGSRVITLGQEYVISGEIVEPVEDQAIAKGAQG